MKSKLFGTLLIVRFLRPITTSQVFLVSDERLRNLRLYYFNVIINTIACPKETNETIKPVIIWLINSYLSNWLIFNNLENIKMLYQPATDLGCPKTVGILYVGLNIEREFQKCYNCLSLFLSFIEISRFSNCSCYGIEEKGDEVFSLENTQFDMCVSIICRII